MAKLTTNWDVVRQNMTNDISNQLHEFRDKAIRNIEQRLYDKGLDRSKTNIYEDSIVFITDDDQESIDGKTYFDEVHEEISKKNWFESL